MHNHNKAQCRHGVVYAQCHCKVLGKHITIVPCQQVHEPISEIVIDSEKLGYWSNLSRDELETISAALVFLQKNSRPVDSEDLLKELHDKVTTAIEDMDSYED